VAHSSTAVGRSTTAGTGGLQAVIQGQLLACPDFSETVEEDLAADFAHGKVRIAAVINEPGAASSCGFIEPRAPIQANRKNAPRFPHQKLFCGTARGFPLADPFSGVLCDPLAGRDFFFCEHANPFDARPVNKELETGELEIKSVTDVPGNVGNAAREESVAAGASGR
jgi:hypothetical protein